MRLETVPRVPFALRPNARPVFDRWSVKKAEDDAVKGSAKLLSAILTYYKDRGVDAQG